MKSRYPLLAALLLTLFVSACGSGSRSTPQGLADALSQALDRGDFAALDDLVAFHGAPAQMKSMLHEMSLDCGRLRCEVSPIKIDDVWRAESEALKANKGLEFQYEVVGLLELHGTSRDPSPENRESFKARIPYALIDGQYRVVSMRFSPDKLSELQATSAEQAAATTLAKGIYDFEAGELRTDFAERASELPADGGEPGAAWQTLVQARAEAIRNRDPDAYAALDEVGAVLYGATDWSGRPVAIELRQRKILAASLTDVIDSRVLGGWQLGNTAILVIEGRNGGGSTIRGAQFMRLSAGGWVPHARDLIEIPEGT